MTEAVDKVILKILTVNTTDVTLQSEPHFKENDKVVQPGPSAMNCLAEHGLAIAITIYENEYGMKYQYLFDMGGLNATIINNLKVFKIDPHDFERIFISHGHYDHWGGIIPLSKLLAPKTEFLMSPDIYCPRFSLSKELTGTDIDLSKLDFDKLKKEQKIRELPRFPEKKFRVLAMQNTFDLKFITEAVMIAPGIFLSGPIKLYNTDEVTKGMLILKDGKMVRDTFRDELALYINVRNKGLIVLTGCGHTGVLNTIQHGQEITGVQKIYAIIGGLHQNWTTQDQMRITLENLKELNPEIICGIHCTGFKFMAESMQQMPLKTALAVVGTTFNL